MDVHHDKITTLASKSSFVLKLSFTAMFFPYTKMSENNKTKKEDTIFTQVQCLTSSQQRNIKLQFKTCTDHKLKCSQVLIVSENYFSNRKSVIMDKLKDTWAYQASKHLAIFA